MYILSCDIGYLNMALCFVQTDAMFSFIKVLFVKRININNIKCDKDCTLPHGSHSSYRMMHLFQAYRQYFDAADMILVEQQPLFGMTGLEAVIVYQYWQKTRLVSPVSMHKHFDIKHLDYENRKIAVVEIATPHLQHMEAFTNQVRQHDIADAFLMVLFHIQKHPPRHVTPAKEIIAFDNFEFRTPDAACNSNRV